MDVLSLLYLAGALQALLLGVTLISLQRKNLLANLFLGLFLCVFSLDLFDYFFVQSGLYKSYPQFVSLVFPLTFAYGPLLYFYVRLMTDVEFEFRTKHALHLVPIFVAAYSLLPVYTLPSEVKIAMVSQPQQLAEALAASPYPFELFGVLLTLSQLSNVGLPFAYAFFIYQRLREHRRNIKQCFSNAERVNLSWLNHLFYIAVGLSVVYLLSTIVQTTGSATVEQGEISIALLSQQIPMLMPILMSVTGLYLGMRAIRQPAIFHPPSQVSRQESLARPEAEHKYQKSALTSEQASAIEQQLLLAMRNERLYTDSNLTLPGLAQRLNVSAHQLSQVLNETLQSNFFDVINFYRIEAAKQLLADPAEQNSPVLAIAMEVGYKSKSAFYRVFKNATGITPSAYRAQQAAAAK